MRVCHLNTNAGGVIDPAQWAIFQAALPGTSRVVLWVHGWMQSAESSDDLAAAMAQGLAPRFPGDDVLFAALHWPSRDAWAELSYFKMEAMALTIGENAGYRIACAAMDAVDEGMEFMACGHSFGAIAAASTLASVASHGTWWDTDRFQYIAIQGAIPNNVLESGQWGGPIQRIYPRVKVTTSKTDTALGTWFGLAERLEFRPDCAAMGAVGPTAETLKQYNANGVRMTVTDIGPAQAKYPMDPFSGHHSTIFIDPVFDLISTP